MVPSGDKQGIEIGAAEPIPVAAIYSQKDADSAAAAVDKAFGRSDLSCVFDSNPGGQIV